MDTARSRQPATRSRATAARRPSRAIPGDAYNPFPDRARAPAARGARVARRYCDPALRCRAQHGPRDTHQWSALAGAWRNPALRLANLGYLGHMWELYAMWAWLAVFLQTSFAAAGISHARQAAEWLTFSAVAAGALGAWLGGVLADRVGRTTVTIGAMAVSGACAAVMGWLLGAPVWLVACVALVWGVSVIADSAQFSASLAELAEPASIGTLLTAQTCAGFLLTLVSIHLVPDVVAFDGWPGAFSMLAAGPFLGCIAMARLRRHPDARRLAGGKG